MLGPAALHFTGVNGTFPTVPYSAALISPMLTFEAWIKPDAGAFSGQALAMLGNKGWGVLLTCGSGKGDGCCGAHLDGALAYWYGADGGTACATMKSSNTTVSYNVWTHVAVTVDTSGLPTAKTVSFYINGAAAGSATGGEVIIPSGGASDPLVFGAFGTGCTSGGCMAYKGYMDEVRLWSAALTPEVVNF